MKLVTIERRKDQGGDIYDDHTTFGTCIIS